MRGLLERGDAVVLPLVADVDRERERGHEFVRGTDELVDLVDESG